MLITHQMLLTGIIASSASTTPTLLLRTLGNNLDEIGEAFWRKTNTDEPRLVNDLPSSTPPFPTDGLLYWLEGDYGLFTGDGTVPAGDGDDIRRWENRGSAPDVEQADTSAQPFASFDWFDTNMMSVYFSRFTNVQHFPGLAFTQPSGNGYNPWTLITVQGPPGSENRVRALLGAQTDNSKMDIYRWGFGNPNPKPLVVAGRAANEADQYIYQQNGVWVYRAEIVDSGPNVHVNMRLDGTQIADSTGAPGSSAAVTSMTIGKSTLVAGGLEEPWNGEIFAFMFWDRYLSSEEVLSVEAYLQEKYVFTYDPFLE